jgi:hypothetical protein
MRIKCGQKSINFTIKSNVISMRLLNVFLVIFIVGFKFSMFAQTQNYTGFINSNTINSKISWLNNKLSGTLTYTDDPSCIYTIDGTNKVSGRIVVSIVSCEKDLDYYGTLYKKIENGLIIWSGVLTRGGEDGSVKIKLIRSRD